MIPDTMPYFPKPKIEGSKNERIRSFVLEEHSMTHCTCCTWLFGKYHQRAALAVDYAKVALQSKAMFLYNIFIKINVHILYSTAT